MEKTKLGISAGLLLAISYLLGLYSGYLITGLLVAYVLLKEEDLDLKKGVLGVLALMLAFSIAGTVLSLIPNLFSLLTSFLEIFTVHFYFGFIHNFFDFLRSILNLAETIAFLLLGLLALTGKQVKLPVIAPLVDKFFS